MILALLLTCAAESGRDFTLMHRFKVSHEPGKSDASGSRGLAPESRERCSTLDSMWVSYGRQLPGSF